MAHRVKDKGEYLERPLVIEGHHLGSR
jgi:hypothetical protein